ncbi:hypothetical protein L227DRAFT_417177 [Lentinus tigrinus ALCF2SS1-6]|uniref:Uncharacterized protein n=1 Tax=Lentinus tigrinus ALCF2SS1-6 TaxID=1328759 RepID=A0A5C2SIT9_9APHY|nr:hypothetical protein L227DRAFT_417177 [Lentinus tigrinus ALCF2SS1-6]
MSRPPVLDPPHLCAFLTRPRRCSERREQHSPTQTSSPWLPSCSHLSNTHPRGHARPLAIWLLAYLPSISNPVWSVTRSRTPVLGTPDADLVICVAEISFFHLLHRSHQRQSDPRTPNPVSSASTTASCINVNFCDSQSPRAGRCPELWHDNI